MADKKPLPEILKKFEKDCNWHEYEGMWIIDAIPEKACDAAKTFPLRDTDIMCNAYCKTGQTWTFSIIKYIQNADKLEKGEEIGGTLIETAPFFELKYGDGPCGYEELPKTPDPRFIKTHLPISFWKASMDANPKTRSLLNLRNPKDTLVSFYNFYKKNPAYGHFTGTWEDYFELVKAKQINYADFFDYHADLLAYLKDRENNLILYYEDMKAEPRKHVIKIAEFLDIKLSDKVIDIIVEKTNFKKAVEKPLMMTEKVDTSYVLRKGEVGDWHNYFNDEQNAYIEKRFKETLAPLGVEFKYDI